MGDSLKINIGVIGTGYLGSFHVEQYKRMRGVNLVGFFDINNDRSIVVEKKHQINSFKNINELLDACDAVSIVTPTTTHFETAISAMNHNCHVLIEKPITKNAPEAKKLVEMSESRGLIIQVGHIERFNPAFHALINQNIRPRFVESHRLAPFNMRGTDVDVVLDLMIHDIDILLSLVKSEIKEIRASGISVLSDNIDTANARLEFLNGCVANLTASRISQKKIRKFRFFENNSYTTIDFLNPSVEKYVVSNTKPPAGESYVIMNNIKEKYILYEKFNIVHHNALKKELENFIDSIAAAKQPLINGRFGLKALKLAIQIQDSIKNK